MNELEQGLERARAALKEMCHPGGIVASTQDVTNYKRVWARDAIIAGLGGLVAGEDSAIQGLKDSLETLAACTGPQGQIPSNVGLNADGSIDSVSYGGLAGRVDTIPWFVIGCCCLGHFLGDEDCLERHQASMTQGLELLNAWEFNSRGLIYMPLSGDWADEFIFHGYVLLPQLLRLWALQLYAGSFANSGIEKQAVELRRKIEINFWPLRENLSDSAVIHPRAFEHYLKEKTNCMFFEAMLNPAGYGRHFDFFGNALAVLLGLGTKDQRASLLEYGQTIIKDLTLQICPSFWPPIFEQDAEWALLSNNFRDKFSNQPYHYHNGGSWPMVSGWWGVALCKEGKSEQARQLFTALQAANARGQGECAWEFNEVLASNSGEPHGVSPCAWSTSAPLLLHAMISESRSLPMANPES